MPFSVCSRVGLAMFNVAGHLFRRGTLAAVAFRTADRHRAFGTDVLARELVKNLKSPLG